MGRKRRSGGGGGGEDRLSDLPDDLLGHILSFLPTPEQAGRAAVLSRRWRYVFAHVHTLSFHDDHPGARYEDNITFELESEERRSPNGCFLDRVNAALLCRRRCAGPARCASLRALRVAFHQYEHWDQEMVHAWVAHALKQSGQELRLDLRLHAHRRCQDGDGSGGDGHGHRRRRCPGGADPDHWLGWHGWSFAFPRALFASAVLRSLRVAHCRLNPPEHAAAVSLPSLEALHLTAVGDTEHAIHRLIAGCPRLADLTLESCSTLTRLSVPDRRLRRLALRCCHSVAAATVDATELRALDYRGAVPAASLFTLLHGARRLAAGAVEFCGRNLATDADLAGFRTLLEHLAAATHLRLDTSWFGCRIETTFFSSFPALPCLHRLDLTGCFETQSVLRVLQQTPNLEALSLSLWHDPESNPVAVPDAPPVPCLQHRLKEIKLAYYVGSDAQRVLVQLLLGNALVLQALRVVFYTELFALKTTLMAEIKQWVVSCKTPKITFR